MTALQIEFPDTLLIVLMEETVRFIATKLEIIMTLPLKKLTQNAPSALFSKQVHQNF